MTPMTGRPGLAPLLAPLLPLFALLVSSPLAAQPAPGWFDPTRVDTAPLIEPVRSHHAGTFGDQDITYDVVAGEMLLSAEDGAPAATMFTTAYLRTDAGAGKNRPVLFLFNGGPGASSSPLHLGIGPVRRPADDPEGGLAPNPLSPIDTVDMVFVDPVGTGYTRLFTEDAGGAFWGITQDADAVLQLIGNWLERHDRQGDPVFLMGESYGGTRVVATAGRAESIRFSGLFLLSPALDFSAGSEVVGNNLPYIALLPSLAATAAYHGVVDAAGRSAAAIFDQAAGFALSDYAAALYQGNTIAAPDKAQMAQQLADLTGMDGDAIFEANLRIDRSDFADRLLEGQRVGRLDARVTGPIEAYRDKRPPGNDPSMAPGGEGRSSGELLDEYFTDQLGIDAGRPYRTLNLHLNGQWDWGGNGGYLPYLSVAPQLQAAMDADPDLHVWIGGGIYDLATPIMAARYVASQIDTDPARFSIRGFEGGHSTFDHEDSRRAICDDIRAFVRARTGAVTH